MESRAWRVVYSRSTCRAALVDRGLRSRGSLWQQTLRSPHVCRVRFCQAFCFLLGATWARVVNGIFRRRISLAASLRNSRAAQSSAFLMYLSHFQYSSCKLWFERSLMLQTRGFTSLTRQHRPQNFTWSFSFQTCPRNVQTRLLSILDGLSERTEFAECALCVFVVFFV